MKIHHDYFYSSAAPQNDITMNKAAAAVEEEAMMMSSDECIAKHEESDSNRIHSCEKLECNDYPLDCMNWELHNVKELSCYGSGRI